MMWWPRRRREAELAEELRTHLELAVEARIARGESLEVARHAARREFGNLGRITESTREAGRSLFAEQLRQDLRFALRGLRRSPGFALVAILSLGIGIGINTAIFGVIDPLLIRKLPVPDPDGLYNLVVRVPPARDQTGFPTDEFNRLRIDVAKSATVAAVAVFDRSGVGIDQKAGIARLRVALVSGNYFDMLDLRPLRGRLIGPADDLDLNAHPVAVISRTLWQRYLGSGTDPTGHRITIHGTSFSIVGVAPDGFSGDYPGRPVDLWIPTMMQPEVVVEEPALITHRNAQWLRLVARIRPGVPPIAAQQAMRVSHRNLSLEWNGPGSTPQELDALRKEHLDMESAAHGFSPQRETLRLPLAILAVTAGLVLLITCANVAGLLLARGNARRKEIALRLALGAGAARLTRQLLTESLLLGLLGTATGLVVAQWGSRWLAARIAAGPVAMFWAQPASLSFAGGLSWRAFAYTALLGLVAGGSFGLLPALRARRRVLTDALSTRGALIAGPRALSAGRALVVVQVAISLVVLIGSALFLRTLDRLRATNLGFTPGGTVLAWTQPSGTGDQPAEYRQVWQRVRDRVAAVPGVRYAGAWNVTLLGGSTPSPTGPRDFLLVEGQAPRPSQTPGGRAFITPDFFRALGVPLVDGREFTQADTDLAHPVVILNRSLAQFYFGGASPIGRLVRFSPGDSIPTTIIGVVHDFETSTPRAAAITRFQTFFPFWVPQARVNLAIMNVVARVTGSPVAFEAPIRRAIAAAVPSLPVLSVNTVQDQLNDVLSQERLITVLTTSLAAIGLLLACMGLYGLVAFTTARRTTEIGVRMALGSSRGRVLRMILRESLVTVVGGLAIGLPLGLGLTTLIRARLYGAGVADPVAIGGALVVLLVVGAVAGLIPARQAAGIDPMVSLRAE